MQPVLEVRGRSSKCAAPSIYRRFEPFAVIREELFSDFQPHDDKGDGSGGL
jgi:hypothetical protein